jgi:hypothetical protein
MNRLYSLVIFLVKYIVILFFIKFLSYKLLRVVFSTLYFNYFRRFKWQIFIFYIYLKIYVKSLLFGSF